MKIKTATTMMMAILAVLVLGGLANADELARYEFTGGSAASTDVDPDSTAGAMTVGAGLGGGFSGGSACTFAPRGNTTTAEATAVSGNDYFEFTVTPGGGKTLYLTSLQIKQYATTTEAGSDRWTSYLFVRSNVDSYASNAGGTTSTRGSLYYSGTPPLPASTDVTIDLSDAAFQGLTGAITFRIYLYHAVTTAGTADYHRLDDVVLNGTYTPASTPGTLIYGK